jgi:hypothetical protein
MCTQVDRSKPAPHHVSALAFVPSPPLHPSPSLPSDVSLPAPSLPALPIVSAPLTAQVRTIDAALAALIADLAAPPDPPSSSASPPHPDPQPLPGPRGAPAAADEAAGEDEEAAGRPGDEGEEDQEDGSGTGRVAEGPGRETLVRHSGGAPSPLLLSLLLHTPPLTRVPPMHDLPHRRPPLPVAEGPPHED